jgi:hypothetical protein
MVRITALSVNYNVQDGIVAATVKNNCGRTGNEMVVAYSVVLSRNLPGRTVANHEKVKNNTTQLLFIISGSAAKRGLWPPRPRGFVITHNDAPRSVGLLWTSGQLVAETSS